MSGSVWLVCWTYYEGIDPRCVCHTEADAKAIVELAKDDELHIEEVRLLRPVDLAVYDQLYLQYEVSSDGTTRMVVDEVRRYTSLIDPGVLRFQTEPCQWIWRGPAGTRTYGLLDVYGTDHDLVRRTFDDQVGKARRGPKRFAKQNLSGRGKP